MLKNGSWRLARVIPLNRRMVSFILKIVHVKKLSISHSCLPIDPSSFVVPGFDCGVFVCMFSYFISMDCSLVFDQDHIDHCLNIIALSIMENCAREPENYEERLLQSHSTSTRVLPCRVSVQN
jgi:hypothetical protein